VTPYTIKVALAVASVDLSKYGEISFLASKDGDDLVTPQETLYVGQKAEDVADRIFKGLTGTEARPWIELRQVGFFDSIADGVAIVLYGATIPDVVPLVRRDACWIDAETLMKHPAAYGLASLAVNYTARGMR
jgi:hypothetical protein